MNNLYQLIYLYIILALVCLPLNEPFIAIRKQYFVDYHVIPKTTFPWATTSMIPSATTTNYIDQNNNNNQYDFETTIEKTKIIDPGIIFENVPETIVFFYYFCIDKLFILIWMSGPEYFGFHANQAPDAICHRLTKMNHDLFKFPPNQVECNNILFGNYNTFLLTLVCLFFMFLSFVILYKYIRIENNVKNVGNQQQQLDNTKERVLLLHHHQLPPPPSKSQQRNTRQKRILLSNDDEM
jgi:hypothetical protein